MESSRVKALIIAAGTGSRLKKYTEETPKCLLRVAGMTLLEHALERFRACDITDISLVRGYKKERIDYSNIQYYENPDYEENNILISLFCAENAINGEIIISYSDIYFEKSIVEKLMLSRSDISIVVDVDWRPRYEGRKDHPPEQAEHVVFDSHGRVARIGKIYHDEPDVNGEFIGMMKLSPEGADLLKKHFGLARARHAGRPFQRAASFERAYLTDMMQEMADHGVPIHCVTIDGGWREIDTVEDYENALKDLGP